MDRIKEHLSYVNSMVSNNSLKLLSSKNVQQAIIQEIKTNIDDIDQNEQKFNSDFGIKFEMNYHDLINSTGLNQIFAELFKQQKVIEKFTTKETLKNLLVSVVNSFVKEKNKARAMEIICELESTLEATFKDVLELLDEFSSLVQNTENTDSGSQTIEENKEEINKDDIDEEAEKIIYENLIHRLNANFIFSIYTYIDAYAMAFLKYTIFQLPDESFYEIMNSVKNIGTPEKAINSSLKIMDKDYKDFLNKVHKKLPNIEHSRKVFEKLHELRHKIAHREPIVTVEELFEYFPQVVNKANAELEKAKREMQNSGIKEIDDFMDYIFELLLNYFLLIELGKSCFTYLLFLDIIYDKLPN